MTASPAGPLEARILLRQMLSYGAIGLGSAGLDALVFWMLLSFASAPPQLSNAVGVICGIVMSFSLNRLYTFRVHDKVARRFAAFFGIGLLGLGLSAAVLAVGLRFGLTAMEAKGLAIILVAALQFVLNRSVTFRTLQGPT